MKKLFLALLIFGIFFAIIVGYIFITGADQPQRDPHPLPEFQPGIWDKPVIRPPYNSAAGLFSYPFMYQYDLDVSAGFIAKYKKYYRPTFVLAPGNNATIVLNVTSFSNTTINVTLAAIDDLPYDGITYVRPNNLLLKPGESGKFSLELSASPNTSFPTIHDMIAEREAKLPVGLWLESEDWRIGQGFYLKVES